MMAFHRRYFNVTYFFIYGLLVERNLRYTPSHYSQPFTLYSAQTAHAIVDVGGAVDASGSVTA